MPRFVERELRRYVECGIPAHGFLRVHCSGCGHDRIVPLPFALRFTLARDHALLTAVIAVAMRAILGFQRERAKRILGVTGRCGAVTVVQRFGGALNLNVHFHAIVLDGVHVQRIDGSLQFHVLPQMRKAECLALTETLAHRVRRLLARRGLLADDAGPPSDETPSALDAWQAARGQVGRCARSCCRFSLAATGIG